MSRGVVIWNGMGGGGGGVRRGGGRGAAVGVYCLLNIPATCSCISATDPLRQVYVLPHRDRSYITDRSFSLTQSQHTDTPGQPVPVLTP